MLNSPFNRKADMVLSEIRERICTLLSDGKCWARCTKKRSMRGVHTSTGGRSVRGSKVNCDQWLFDVPAGVGWGIA
jgi:hypothetical protein